jgi:hypothetical protein
MSGSTAATTRRIQPGAGHRTVARQVNLQRRTYARAVLGSLARSLHDRPTPQIQHVLQQAMSSLGERLPAATLHKLAVEIAAGRPVTLPQPRDVPAPAWAQYASTANRRQPLGLERCLDGGVRGGGCRSRGLVPPKLARMLRGRVLRGLSPGPQRTRYCSDRLAQLTPMRTSSA